MGYADHIVAAAGLVARCAVVTFSDTRTLATDASGDAVVRHLESAGHRVAHRDLLPDDVAPALQLIYHRVQDKTLDLLITTGGTGISRRDHAADVVADAIRKPIPGFGELFRLLSFQEIGSGAMLSRAVAGVTEGVLIFALPGSTAAVDLAMTRLILPELPHLLSELRK